MGREGPQGVPNRLRRSPRREARRVAAATAEEDDASGTLRQLVDCTNQPRFESQRARIRAPPPRTRRTRGMPRRGRTAPR
eukprot:7386782-Prymnesium_polylepis.1